MQKFLIVLFTLLLSMPKALAMNVDAFIDQNLAPVTNAIANLIFFPMPGTEVPIIIFWILFAGIFFTFYFRGLSVWGFKHAIDTVISHDKDHADNHGHKEGNTGEVSSLQALATALSGTIGIGSIAHFWVCLLSLSRQLQLLNTEDLTLTAAFPAVRCTIFHTGLLEKN